MVRHDGLLLLLQQQRLWHLMPIKSQEESISSMNLTSGRSPRSAARSQMIRGVRQTLVP
jgi:hypothetical protein